MADTVFIDGLQVRAVIGVHDWERHVLQDLRIDLALETDIRTAAMRDDLSDAIDYSAVADCVGQLTRRSRFELIEALAETIATTLLERFDLKGLLVRITKPGAVSNARAVGVEIKRP